MKDWRGTPIRVGATVIYASHMGARTWVTEATVREVLKGELVVALLRNTRGDGSAGRLVRLRALDRVTVLPEVG